MYGREILTGLSRIQCADIPCVAGQLIRHRDISDGHVAVVDHIDLVGDRFTQSIFFTVGRSTGRSLGDRKVRFILNRIYCCIRGLGSIPNMCGHSICEGTIHNVCVGDGVGRSSLYGSAGFDVCKFFLFQRHAFNFIQRDRLCVLIDVRRGNTECDYII